MYLMIHELGVKNKSIEEDAGEKILNELKSALKEGRLTREDLKELDERDRYRSITCDSPNYDEKQKEIVSYFHKEFKKMLEE